MDGKMEPFVPDASRKKQRFKMSGPTLPISEETHAAKYRGSGESHRDSCNRVAGALQDSSEHFRQVSEITQDMRFLFAGRIQAAMGSTKRVTAYNCFVSGTIADTAVDGSASIMARATEAFRTMRLGGGIGYDFSTLRPRGSLIRKLQSQASGPVSFMGIYDAVCATVSSAGHRRGAQMAVLRVDHPDIEEFVRAKQNDDKLRKFNLSVAVTDEFMECLLTGRPFKLRWGGQVYREIDPAALWDLIMHSTWDYAEPGVIFIDTVNNLNNLYYCETIAATNPCGEQPLPPYGACLLGSVNLPRYLVKEGRTHIFDWDRLGEDLPHIVRAMDNVIDRTDYPLHEQEEEAQSKRRMGIGVTGLANCVEAMGFPYGSPAFLQYENDILWRINRDCYRASARLAAEKGAFSLYEESSYLSGKFIQQAFGEDEETLDLIRRHGIRNSHLTSIAPTGTISLTANNVSSGIEPVFAHRYNRTIIKKVGPEIETVTDYGYRELGVEGRTCDQVTVAQHLEVLATAQRHVDSAVAKTCNVSGNVPWEDFKKIYVEAWERGCKGITTFRTDGKRAGILVADDSPSEGAACRIDPETGRRDCD